MGDKKPGGDRVLATDIVVVLYFCAQILFVLSAVVFAISTIDDLFVDAYFYFLAALKGAFRHERERREVALMADLLEQPIAVMLPAWQEGGVIAKSVSNLVDTLDYCNYHVFIGTYPNDFRTQNEVNRLVRKYDKVHKVVTPRPGPTCKADCLNCIVGAILDFESTISVTFAGFVLQDAEDIVDPSSLKVFNLYLREYDLVQIPVYSLKRKWRHLTGGHYMDEFAEFQSREIRVREHMARLVPGAGVGTVYSRKAIEAFLYAGEVFNSNSLTEDYEFSLRLHGAGFKQAFACLGQKRGACDTRAAAVSHAHHPVDSSGDIATREYFPGRFWAAVRQKTRWTIGISLQGWVNFRWRGDWRIRYFLWRDRKMLFFAQAIAAGFFSLAMFAAVNAYHWVSNDGYRLAPILSEGSAFWYLIYFNLLGLLMRLLQRCYWSARLYGWTCVALVPVRYMWGALINYLAVTRAIIIFAGHLITGRPIGWDKTAHDFPDDITSGVDDTGSGERVEEKKPTALPEYI